MMNSDMKKTYIPRLFDEILRFVLESKGAVMVVGLITDRYFL